MRAKKSFGQHFLTNEDIARRIAGSLSAKDKQGKIKVLEVGPGRGMLTKYLLMNNYDLKVVEADKDMVAYLEENFPELSFSIIFKDFMKLDLADVFKTNEGAASEFYLIGNFPYNISSQIVFKMLEFRSHIPEMVGMFQKEMAERIIAKPGGKDYGVISVLTQAFYSGELLFKVGAGNFNPPPKVQSAVIRLKRKEKEPDCDHVLFRKIVKQAFNQRRKMLRNTVKPFFNDSSFLNDEYFNQRPEVLSVNDFITLTQKFESMGIK